MSPLTKDTSQRMREAFTVEMSPATKQAHTSSIGEALSTVGSVQARPPMSWWRMRVPALGAALLVVLPVGTAIAAESALPGDLLYPVKRVVEPVRSIIDSDVVARHRVDELVRFLDAPVATDRLPDALRDAREAVSDLPIGHDLHVVFDQLTDRATDTRTSDAAPHREADEAPSSTETDTERSIETETDTETDRSLTDVPDEPDKHPHDSDSRGDSPHEHQDISDTSTTTESETKRDEPPPDHSDR